jgi:cell division transport system permease protein
VGATNWFIRLPFLFEGVVQGALGALVAAVVVVVLDIVLNLASPNNILYQMRLSTSEVVTTSLVVILIGVLIGSFGSALGIRRFLDA